MFTKCDLKTFQLDDGSNYVGLVKINESRLKNTEWQRPFTRDFSKRKIVRVGTVDYNQLDQFIIGSLNDYYKRITTSGTLEERQMMLQNYNRLYTSWTNLNAAKTNHELKKMNEAYDEISYQLYLLGYKMSN